MAEHPFESTATYAPSFPFYEAEPTWFYKGYGTSDNSDSDEGSGGGAPTIEMPTNWIELVDEFTGRYPFNDLYTFHLGIESLPSNLNISANTPKVKVILEHAKSISMNNGLNGDNVIAVLMPAIEEINDNGTFSGGTCDAYLGPNAKSIAAYAFSSFTGTINCAFSAERGVELGAPWGASDSATINYDVPVSSWPM